MAKKGYEKWNNEATKIINKSQYWPRGAKKRVDIAENEKA